jgi:hypothetical protein
MALHHVGDRKPRMDTVRLAGGKPAGPSFIRFVTLIVVAMLAWPGTVPAGAWAANGCSGDLAGAWGAICPADTANTAYIEYVLSTSYGVSIRLTPEGVTMGTSCDGAALVVLISSGLYAQLPLDQRSAADLLWAEPYITSEVMAHSVLTATNIPELVSHGNPIDIVFADYSTPGSQGLFWSSLDNPDHVFAPGTCAGNVV